MKNKKIETGFMHIDQLYNLQSDNVEQQNVANEQHDIIGTLKQQLEEAKKHPIRPGWNGLEK